MKKLIELLNEYDGGELEYTIIDGNVKRRVKNMINPDKPYKWCSVWWYSKSFGFIEWLVDNDKINFNKVEKNLTSQECLGILIDRGYYTNVVLMLLSIQDNPIEFLVSILK